jgi:hypothetical protein
MRTAKQVMLEAVHRLPNDATFQDIAEQVSFIAAVYEGEGDLKARKVISNEEMKQRLKQWLTKPIGQGGV